MNLPSVFSSKRPRYQRVAEALLVSIERGDFPVGSTLPTEAKICEQFGVSRHTVREALRSLSTMGLVSSQQGVGTQVIHDRVEQRYAQTLKGIRDLWQYVKDTRRQLISIRDVTADEVDAPLAENSGRSWRVLEGLRFVEDSQEPVAWTQVFVLPKYAGVFDDIREEVLIYSLVERRYGLVTQSVRQTITAVEIGEAVAGLLKVKPGSCGLAILREYVGSTGEIYEITWSIHPVSRYKYAMEISLSYGAN